METFPKVGMKFEQVRSRIKRYDTINKFGNFKIRESLINQARLHEGAMAADELRKEFSDLNNHSTNKIGYSPKYSINFDNIKF